MIIATIITKLQKQNTTIWKWILAFFSEAYYTNAQIYVIYGEMYTQECCVPWGGTMAYMYLTFESSLYHNTRCFLFGTLHEFWKNFSDYKL